MITGIHHASISVSDMDKALSFYRDTLGLTLLFTKEAEGEETSRRVGVKGAKMEIAMLQAGNDQIELIQYVAPVGRPYDRLNCDVGTMHVAFRVSNMRVLYDELLKKGIKFNTPPSEPRAMKGSLIVYFNDPDGAQLELVGQV